MKVNNNNKTATIFTATVQVANMCYSAAAVKNWRILLEGWLVQ